MVERDPKRSNSCGKQTFFLEEVPPFPFGQPTGLTLTSGQPEHQIGSEASMQFCRIPSRERRIIKTFHGRGLNVLVPTSKPAFAPRVATGSVATSPTWTPCQFDPVVAAESEDCFVIIKKTENHS
jgi:hypothetical protein